MTPSSRGGEGLTFRGGGKRRYPVSLTVVACAGQNQTPLDFEGNSDRIVRSLEAARDMGAKAVCCPELCITGYGCEDAFLHRATTDAASRMLVNRILPATRSMVVCVGLPYRIGGKVFNTAAIMVDGKLLGLVAKQNLPDDGIHYEPRWFTPWPAGQVAQVDVLGRAVPLGDQVFRVGGVGIGVEICEDAWVEDRPLPRLHARDARLLFHPSASHFSWGKQLRRFEYMRAAQTLGCVYAYACPLGNEMGSAVYDGGHAIWDEGGMVARAERFSFEPFNLAVAVVPIPSLVAVSDSVMEVPFSWQSSLEGSRGSVSEVTRRASDGCEDPPWDVGHGGSAHEEFTRAVALGMMDYACKAGARGFVVSLSGGADSAAVASLVWLGWQLARQELGVTRVRARFGLSDGQGLESILRTVYQATEHSSSTTRAAAAGLAAALGATHAEWDVQPVVNEYRRMLELTLGRAMAWSEDDVTLQNIQSRVRGPGAWMWANVQRSLLLVTSNRSELAVGYSTMDGDTCGGLAPISGVSKHYLRQWLRWLSEEGPHGVGRVPGLEPILALEPTAELRPVDRGQTDEGDLMPYRWLEALERSVIRDRKRRDAVLQDLVAAGCPGEEAGAQLDRFLALWRASQWKRERMAPGIHVDDFSVDPRTWCRMPILAGSIPIMGT